MTAPFSPSPVSSRIFHPPGGFVRILIAAILSAVVLIAAPVSAMAEDEGAGCGVVAENGALNLHFRSKCSPEELKQLHDAIKVALDQSERQSQLRESGIRNWSDGRERNLGRLGEFTTKIPVSPLHR